MRLVAGSDLTCRLRGRSCPRITNPAGHCLPLCKRLSRHFSPPLDDERRLVVNTVLFANLAETVVSFRRILQQGIADFLCRLAIVLTPHFFYLPPFSFVAAVIDSVAIQNKNVS